MMARSAIFRGLAGCAILLPLFIALKLSGGVDWSWWWVLAPLWLPVDWLDKHRLFNLSGLGLWGAPVTFVVASFISYWFHRSEHRR